eukprot:gnl/MRDRNA2_/MRDRNA2_34287_c0_seq1.p1 gnl/MRDRNA2_/MRDRNA2_34287_c0~~gnl/MRDRNA2_/MRDRNA2_34287_c0_seq1.p1  ORF type:complete len:634 (-),score=107.78 gnl/MRDRNA2_/MRDRNA2_34287_c0_seq1:366-2051(-)
MYLILTFCGFILGLVGASYPRVHGATYAQDLLDGVYIDHVSFDPDDSCAGSLGKTLSGEDACEGNQYLASRDFTPWRLRDIYFFNVTNADEVTKEGAVPQLQQLPPVTLKAEEGPAEVDDEKLNSQGIWWFRRGVTWTAYGQPKVPLDAKIVLPNPLFFTTLALRTQHHHALQHGPQPLFVHTTVGQAIGWQQEDAEGNGTDFSLRLARNRSTSEAMWSAVYSASRHKEFGLRYVRADLGVEYHCGFDRDCTLQEVYNASIADSCLDERSWGGTCKPEQADGFSLLAGFSYIPSGNFGWREAANSEGKKRWNIQKYWSIDSTFKAHLLEHFIKVNMTHSSAKHEVNVNGASAKRWEAQGLLRRDEACHSSKNITSSQKIDSPGIDCDGFPGTAHVGAVFDLSPPLYASLPGLGPAGISAPGNVANLPPNLVASHVHYIQQPCNNYCENLEEFQSFVDAEATTGMVLRSQIAVQMNLRMRRPSPSGHSLDVILPLYVVRDRAEATDAQIQKAIELQKYDATLRATSMLLVGAACTCLFLGFMLLRGKTIIFEMFSNEPWIQA